MTGAELDKLTKSIDELPAILRAEMHSRGLEAAGKIMIKRQRAELERQGFVDTGQLRDSIGVINESPAGVDVGSTGKRSRRYKIKSTHSGKRRYATGSAVRNAEVAYILHYGAPHKGIQPTHWMDSAANDSEPEILDAIETIYDELLNKIF